MNLDDKEEGADRSDVERTKVLRNAKIIAPRRRSVIHCTVQNITSGGACLKLANTYGVPDSLRIDLRARPHAAPLPRDLAHQ